MEQEIFRPVRGTEESIHSHPITNGYIYFAYDTGKIYMDRDGTRYSLGGSNAASSTGFSWAHGSDESIIKAEEDEASQAYLIYQRDFDDQVLPQVGALILNSDGRFFRVLEVKENHVVANLIAVSGSGGGAISTQDTYLTYDNSTVDSGFTYIYGQTTYANFSARSDVDSKVTLTFVITQKGEQIESFSEQIDSGSTYSFNTSRLPKGNNITITVRASSVNSNMGANDSRTRRIITDISTVELGIKKDNSFNPQIVHTGEAGISFIPIYNGLAQSLEVVIDNDNILNLNKDTRNKQYMSFVPTGSSIYTVIIPAQNHGVHNVKLRVSTVISGKTLYSEYISYDLAWRNIESNQPIIWFGDYPKTVINYDKCIIPFMVYDPTKETKSNVYIYHNGAQIPTSPLEVTYSNSSWINLDVTNLYEAGDGVGRENRFTFVCGGTTETISIYVTTEGARDLGLVNQNKLILNLNSAGRSNQETSTSRSIWSFNNFTTTFKNFNWYNNGWLNDGDDNGSYLSIANGASVDVNLNTFTLNSGNSDYTFEIRFRVRNIQEYSTLIKTIPQYYIEEDDRSHTLADISEHNYTIKTDNEGYPMMDKNSPKNISNTAGVVFKYLNRANEGFCIGTQEAYFKTPYGIANVRYKEDEIINLSFVVSYTSKLLSIYLNGILSGALDLSSTGYFTMDNNKFEINSDYCDIDIFKLRIYNTELSMPEVIHNYISDIHDVELYDQNQLTDITTGDGTNLLYSKVLEYNNNYPDNPTMPYAVWEIIDNGASFNDPNKAKRSSNDDKLPYFKGNDRYCKITFVNPSLDRAFDLGLVDEKTYINSSPSYVAIGVGINVQGTSSQAYPRRNFKTKFKSAVNKKDADGVTHSDWGWYYIGGPFKNDYNAWLTGKDINGNSLSEEEREAALTRCSFKKWHMDNEVCSTNKFTWKIDYMESSGTYNTGFANLVGNNIYDYHPLSRYEGFNNTGRGFRTSVYGFPCLVFHKHSTPEDKRLNEDQEYLAYEYIGRYNLNLDKGSNEYYGFELDDIHPYVENEKAIADVAECWELRDNQGTWTSFKYPGATERISKFGTLTTEGTPEIIKHFEARYNNESDQLEYASGISTAAELGYTDTTQIKMADGTFRDLSIQANKNAYIREKMSNLERLFDWLDSTDTTNVPNTDTGVPLAEPQTFTSSVAYMVDVNREDDVEVPYYVDKDGNRLVKITDVIETDERNYYVYNVNDENIMEQAIAPDGYTGRTRIKDDILVTYTTDCAGYRLNKFIKEFRSHFDLEYCLIYFILTELLLCYDSRGKNMMLASWGPQQVGGDYIWFPIFYDIDTQLGLNNIGAVLWDYDTDATLDGTFSTANSVLWQNFFNGFREEIEEKYRVLRLSQLLTEKTIEGAYLCDPEVFNNSYAMRGVRPIIALGLDEWYKYIAPGKVMSNWYSGTNRRYGFYVQSYENGQQKTTDASYVYTCQGDRKLSRELFIRNRLNYLDSWWLADSYDSTSGGYKNEIMIRANANDTSTSDTYLDADRVTDDVLGYTRVTYPKKFYDAVPEFKLTPFLSQYVTVFYDEDPVKPPIKFDGINAVTTNTTPSVENGYRAIHPYNEQLTYIPGGDYLSDLGDLSLKYPSHFKLTTGKRLIQLLIGSDVPNYANGIIGKEAGTFDLNDSASGVNKKGLLQKVVLTGLTALSQGQDVSGSEKLREFRALNTQIPTVVFAEGSPLDTVHLPKTLTSINLVHAKNLTNILTSKPVVMTEDAELGYKYVDSDLYKGLYIENLTDWNTDTQISDISESEYNDKISKVSTLNFTDVNLGYDSYKVLCNAIDIREKFRRDNFLAINFENVNWSPYKLIESDTEFSDSITFYELTDHNNFKVYENHSEEKWNVLKLNNKLFTYDNNTSESLITDISLLETIINDYNRAGNVVANNHYRNTKGSEEVTIPILTGIMYINNTPETALDETNESTGLGIKEINERFFPELKLYAKFVNESNIVKYIYRHDNIDDEKDLIRYASNVTHPNSITTKNDDLIRNHYDFVGWCLEDPEVNPEAEVVLVYNGSGYDLTETWNNLEFTEEQSVITLFAKYVLHPYNITYNIDGESIVITTNYNEILNLPDIIPYKDDSALSLYDTYKFKGWASDINGDVKDLTNKRADADATYYAIFEIVNVKNNPLSGEYFTYRNNSYCLNRNDFRGKITIPAKINGIQIKAFNDLGNSITDNERNKQVTHVFFEEGSEIDIIGRHAFNNWSKLKYVELPNGNITIGDRAFENDNLLFDNVTISQDLVTDFFLKIKQINQGAFFNTAGNNLLSKEIKLFNISEIQTAGFFGIKCNTLQLGHPENGLDISRWTGQNIFNQSQINSFIYNRKGTNMLTENEISNILTITAPLQIID